jgi:hypothetical protein
VRFRFRDFLLGHGGARCAHMNDAALTWTTFPQRRVLL